MSGTKLGTIFCAIWIPLALFAFVVLPIHGCINKERCRAVACHPFEGQSVQTKDPAKVNTCCKCKALANNPKNCQECKEAGHAVCPCKACGQNPCKCTKCECCDCK